MSRQADDGQTRQTGGGLLTYRMTVGKMEGRWTGLGAVIWVKMGEVIWQTGRRWWQGWKGTCKKELSLGQWWEGSKGEECSRGQRREGIWVWAHI